jgi:hypothetical protein
MGLNLAKENVFNLKINKPILDNGKMIKDMVKVRL